MINNPFYISENNTKNIKVKPKPDFITFCSQLMIQSGGGLTPFNLYDYQKAFYRDVEESFNIIVAKTRQMGLSEVVCAYALWRAYQNPGFSAAVFSTTQSDSSVLGERIRMMALTFPDIKLKSDAKTRLELQNGGSIRFLPSNDDAGRGLPSVSLIVFDECAFIDNLDRLKTAALASTSMVPDKKVVYISTPNGTTGEYWNMLSSNNGVEFDLLTTIQQVREGVLKPYQTFVDENKTKKVIIHYKAHPVYSQVENFLELKKRESGYTQEQVEQEFDLGFLSESHQFFNHDEILKNVDVNLTRYSNRDKHTLNDAELRNDQWVYPIYAMTIDPSAGGSDKFAAIVWDVRMLPWKIVDWYYLTGRDKLKDEHISHLIYLIERYKIYCINYEVNAVGEYLESSLRQQLKNIGITKVQLVPIRTTMNNKGVRLRELKAMLQAGKIIYPNVVPLLDEYPDIVSKNGKIEACNGNYDDFVMSMSFAVEWQRTPPQWGENRLKRKRINYSVGCYYTKDVIDRQKSERDPFLTFDSTWR